MLMLTEDRQRQSDERLAMKTQKDTLKRAAIQGAGLSPWAAQVLPDIVEQIFFPDLNDMPLRDGQILFQCTALEEGAGKSLEHCRQVQVRLTIHDIDSDRPLHREQGQTAMRQQVLCRITEEARSQGGLLTQEDLAYLLLSSERTIRRDVAALKQREIFVATRGLLKDIGPSVSHKGVAIRHWLMGKEPADVARVINHSVQAVDRYLNDFRRVVFATRMGYDDVTTARITRLSPSLIATYRAIYDTAATEPSYAYRWQEIMLQLGSETDENPELSGKKGAKPTLCQSHSANQMKIQEVHG